MSVKCITLACSCDTHNNVISVSDAFALFKRRFTVPIRVLGCHPTFEGSSATPSEMVDLWDTWKMVI